MNMISYGHSISKLLMLRRVSLLWWLASVLTLRGEKYKQFFNIFKESDLNRGIYDLLYKIFMVLEDTKFFILVVKNSY